MNPKIAITGLPGCNKTFLAQALSCITGIPYIRNKTMYEWCRLCNVVDSTKLRWNDSALIASCSFFERVVIESYFDEFISDGASFSEVMWLKSNFSKQRQSKTQNKCNNVVENLEKISALYSAKQYSIIIHVCSDADTCINDLYLQLYIKYNIPYKQYNTAFMEKTVIEIANNLHLPMIHSAENAICQTNKNIFRK